MVCAVIEQDKCLQEGKDCSAARACQVKAIKSLDGSLYVERKLCNGCGDCVSGCENGAISIKQI